MNAKEARAMTNIATISKLNFQRRAILERIKRLAACGESQLVQDDPRLVLDEADVEFFKKLGYTVNEPRDQFKVITW